MKQCPSCGGDCGRTEKTGCRYGVGPITKPPLKPCPLCGGPVVVVDHPDHLAASGSWSIYCYRCNLDLSQPYIANNYPGADKEEMRKLAIKDWNRRAK